MWDTPCCCTTRQALQPGLPDRPNRPAGRLCSLSRDPTTSLLFLLSWASMLGIISPSCYILYLVKCLGFQTSCNGVSGHWCLVHHPSSSFSGEKPRMSAWNTLHEISTDAAGVWRSLFVCTRLVPDKPTFIVRHSSPGSSHTRQFRVLVLTTHNRVVPERKEGNAVEQQQVDAAQGAHRVLYENTSCVFHVILC